MKDSLKRDNLLTIVGTVLTVGFFVLVVYLPGERACQAARSEITIANRTIDATPTLILEAAQLEQKRGERCESSTACWTTSTNCMACYRRSPTWRTRRG